ncbi:ATP-binding protein [Achromobacter pestifer]|uniref:histidine kinase n=1 Tax=Achromobacter pestifer TaxID=1353889 RepID=A0A6S6Z885_9BURK|nr:ATP-binding protein [Achromobacter pestifer]CAB3654772.1 Sensor protein QseC [Achromobacter pestifer]
MTTLRRQVAITLLLAMLATWLTVFVLIYKEQTRAETGMVDQDLRDAAKKALLSLPTSLLQTAPSSVDRFELSASNRFDGESFNFQVWALPNKQLVIQSPSAPAEPLIPDFQEGFRDVSLKGERWRAYAVADADRRIQVQFAKSMAQLREETLSRMQKSLMFLSVLFLVLTGLTWLVMRRAFRPVDRARDAILGRCGMDLTPLPTAGMPGELQPFIRSINDLLERLSASLERERRFLADAAHELRTPLAALGAYAELAARSDTPQAREQAVEKLRAVACRTTRLAEQLLDQAHTEAQSEGLTEPVPLNRLAEMIVRDSEALANRKHQRISLDAEAVVMNGNINALGVLLRNLLDNALRYTPEGGRVAVSCGPLPDGGARLCVKDNGPGIPASERERIFDRFYRQPGTIERGSGIGLSLVARIAAIHGARIEWEPGLDGRGVGIAVTFPPSGG